jgi:hypothetical protein
MWTFALQSEVAIQKTTAFQRQEDRRSRNRSSVVRAWLAIMCRTDRPPADPELAAVEMVRR